MKINRKLLLFSLSIFCTFVFGCGVALTPRLTAKIPPKTETEVFRLNLFDGEVKNLYGVNIGLLNRVLENLIGLQVGGANVADGKTSVQVGGRTVRENKEVYVAQIGGVNIADGNVYAAQVGFLNKSAGGFTIQTGAANMVESENNNTNGGLQLGIYNEVTEGNLGNRISDEGYYVTAGVYNNGGGGVKIGVLNNGGKGGVKIGVLNISPSGLSIGAINVGERDNFLIGILNFCDGFPTVMIGFNYCWRLRGW
ncbi:putative lipoprotein [Leptospira santarosai str. CBC1416]|uniref:Putative lipoprotein n=1 Tax=Leptospira santarosai str. CBC1416 TaxID=1193059 RepID=M6VYF3_9LEPT|nr:putative lipoprotein [Leptospira santarosai str. CBC1416]